MSYTYEVYDSTKEYSAKRLRKGLWIDNVPKDVYEKSGGVVDEVTSPITSYMEVGTQGTKFTDEIFKFRNGTSLERAIQFLEQGKGFTSLMSSAGYYIPEKDYITNYGIQVHQQSYQGNIDWFSKDSIEYANMQAIRENGVPVVIEGEIPSQYVYQQTNQHEFAIPKDYYDKIQNATIRNANTGDVLYELRNGNIIQSQSKSSNRSDLYFPAILEDDLIATPQYNLTNSSESVKELKESQVPRINENVVSSTTFIKKEGANKYYTQEQLDALLSFEHKTTIEPTSETRYKNTWNDGFGESYNHTNYDEFEKLGGNMSFAKLHINKEHQNIIKKYWDILNKADGNLFIAAKEAEKLFSELDNLVIIQYQAGVHRAFTEHATGGKHNDINKYMMDNKSIYEDLVKHYLETGEILNVDSITLNGNSDVQQNNLPVNDTNKIEWINENYSNIVESDEAKVKLYDYIHNRSATFDDIIRANASAHKNDTVYHGMSNPFEGLTEQEAFELIDKGDIAIADFSLENIINNKNIEICVSNKPIFSYIGIKGKADIVAYFKQDVGSHADSDGTRHTCRDVESKYLNSILNGEIDIDSTELGSHQEGFARNWNIESLWVKKNFYEQNKEQVHSLLQKYNIQQLDVIENFDKGQIETLYTKDLIQQVLTPQEAVSLYESYSDEFYSSQGKDPVKERQKIKDFYESKNFELPDDLKKYYSDNESKPEIEAVETSLNSEDELETENIFSDEQKIENNVPEKTESLNQNINEPTKEPTIKSNEPLPKKTEVKNSNKKGNLSKKTLNGNGKTAIGLAIAGLIVGGAIALSKKEDDNDKRQKEPNYQQYGSINSQPLMNDPYSMQMAKDISSYRYGKHMTGFVNF